MIIYYIIKINNAKIIKTQDICDLIIEYLVTFDSKKSNKQGEIAHHNLFIYGCFMFTPNDKHVIILWHASKEAMTWVIFQSNGLFMHAIA